MILPGRFIGGLLSSSTACERRCCHWTGSATRVTLRTCRSGRPSRDGGMSISSWCAAAAVGSRSPASAAGARGRVGPATTAACPGGTMTAPTPLPPVPRTDAVDRLLTSLEHLVRRHRALAADGPAHRPARRARRRGDRPRAGPHPQRPAATPARGGLMTPPRWWLTRRLHVDLCRLLTGPVAERVPVLRSAPTGRHPCPSPPVAATAWPARRRRRGRRGGHGCGHRMAARPGAARRSC